MLIEYGCCKGVQGPSTAVLKFHLCVHRSGVLGCRNENFAVNAGVHWARRAYAPTRRRIARQGHICVRDACAMSFQRSGIKRENLVRSRNNRDTHGVARLVFSVVSTCPSSMKASHRT